ncbi:MAG: hypothetical protein ACKKMV_00395 [Candidatus Nealsonbacteria bacterium]
MALKTMDDLRQRINIILNEEKRAYKANGRIGGGLGSFNIKIGDGWTTVGEIPKLISDSASLDAIQSPNATTLLKFYSTLNSKSKEQFKTILLSYLSKDSQYFDVAYLIFFVLHRVGETVKSIEQARRNLKGDADHGFSNMLAMLAKIVSHEHSYISRSLYQQIKETMQGETESSFRLFEKINSAELELLKKELADVNPEINKDREKVINLWEEKFGSKEIPSVIDEIEENFSGGDFTPTKFATCIDRVRVLLVDVLRNIAIGISQRKDDKKIDHKTDEHTVFDYLRSKKFLNDNEWQLVRALHGIASDKGAHTIVALKEYARIAKNMVYEIMLIVLSRHDQK